MGEMNANIIKCDKVLVSEYFSNALHMGSFHWLKVGVLVLEKANSIYLCEQYPVVYYFYVAS